MKIIFDNIYTITRKLASRKPILHHLSRTVKQLSGKMFKALLCVNRVILPKLATFKVVLKKIVFSKISINFYLVIYLRTGAKVLTKMDYHRSRLLSGQREKKEKKKWKGKEIAKVLVSTSTTCKNANSWKVCWSYKFSSLKPKSVQPRSK